MKKLFYAGFIVLLLVMFGAGTATGILVGRQNTSAAIASGNSSRELQLVTQAWNLTQDHYVDRAAVEPQRLAYATIAGMITSLGDTGHSTFLTPEEIKAENSFERGQFEGVGLEVQQKNNEVVVVAPIEGSPAQRAGIRSGDVILKVDGQPVQNVSDAVRHILGKAGTPVTLTIRAASGATRDIALTRARINVELISWRRLPDTGAVHLRLTSFARGASAQLDSALSAIKGQDVTSIILDLRGNPGGLLDEAVGVTSRFLGSGNVLLEKDAQGQINPVGVVAAARTDLPVVVLINQGTASAAEIVSGALRDAGRARLVGEKTFGTGTVLSQFSLADGSALLLAIQEWLTPSGQTIWHVGLPPDETVTLAADATPLTPNTEQGLTLSQVKASGDGQLLRALSLLP
jgi:carboxyl-terminal processing protease